MPPTKSHVLTNIDPERRRADCAICGQDVMIRWFVEKRGRGVEGWKCRAKDRWTTNNNRDQSKRAWGRLVNREGPDLRYNRAIVFMNLWRLQQGKCAVCGEALERPHIDHCHEFRMIRGLLCGSCNAAAGMARDDADKLRKLADYIERFDELFKSNDSIESWRFDQRDNQQKRRRKEQRQT